MRLTDITVAVFVGIALALTVSSGVADTGAECDMYTGIEFWDGQNWVSNPGPPVCAGTCAGPGTCTMVMMNADHFRCGCVYPDGQGGHYVVWADNDCYKVKVTSALFEEPVFYCGGPCSPCTGQTREYEPGVYRGKTCICP